MLTIIMATTIALLLGFIVLMKSRTNDPAQLNEQRPAVLTIGVQIICGDCSGEDDRAIKTYLDRFGNCSHCGGRSYVLASALAANGVLSRAARLREAYIASSNGRVLPFDINGSRASRSERIAV
jgi:hypothetical protein